MAAPLVSMTTKDIATELANAFAGTEWTVTYVESYSPYIDASRINLTHSNGASVLVEYIKKELKLAFTPEWPRDVEGSIYRPEDPAGCVQVSAVRSWPIIVNDVTRRLLTKFQEQYPEMLAVVKRVNEAYSNQQKVADELAAMLGTKAESHGRPTTQFHGYYRLYRICINHGGTTVNMELSSVKAETARKIIEILKQNEAR